MHLFTVPLLASAFTSAAASAIPPTAQLAAHALTTTIEVTRTKTIGHHTITRTLVPTTTLTLTHTKTKDTIYTTKTLLQAPAHTPVPDKPTHILDPDSSYAHQAQPIAVYAEPAKSKCDNGENLTLPAYGDAQRASVPLDIHLRPVKVAPR